MGFQHLLYNNTPSKVIVNAVYNITYRPLIEADDTGRCTLIIWPIFRTRLISFIWSFKWWNYFNSFSNKTVTISVDRQHKYGLNVIPFVFFNNTIIVQVRYIIIETKEVARIGYNGLHLSTHAEKETSYIQ